jgi:hypothetical protein
MVEAWVEVDVVFKRMYRKERMLKWPGHTTLLSGTVRLPSEKVLVEVQVENGQERRQSEDRVAVFLAFYVSVPMKCRPMNCAAILCAGPCAASAPLLWCFDRPSPINHLQA